ncbi:hypothetical protein EVAR_43179_1 [Eumeta japonica]|uniref:Uncharacterized protein n=1 Tax=Eumeta variegata TaxID=151549 RepID=A0A4C1XN26_EUMVA|nr:hypothetical protein EVAR_43179_1 [Eumeta japonica]
MLGDDLMGLFLMMENKCLELGYFSWAWKVAAIKIILVVPLDIKGSIDNVWWPALKTQLLTYNCPINLFDMVQGYVRDQEVNV